jgi:hypothetical protein
MVYWLRARLYLLVCLVAVMASNPKVTITSITPNKGPASGGTKVLVRGIGLETNEKYPTPVCKFGSSENLIEGTYVTCTPQPRQVGAPEPTTPQKTAHCIQCEPGPAAESVGTVPFSVSLIGDFSDAQNSMEFRYYAPPVVEKIVPIYGPKNGGTVVTVYGKDFIDFDQYTRCSFGIKQVPATFISDSLLYCVAPPSDVTTEAMPFRVTLNDQQNTQQDIVYWYYPNPAIMRLIPDRGPTNDKTLVRIEGQDMDAFNNINWDVDNRNDTYCRFGMDYVTKADVKSDTLVFCEAPPSPIVRTVLVDLTLNDADMVLNPQDWTDNHLPFTYYAPPYLFGAVPDVGPTSGNTTVIVYGSNFNNTGQIKCKFGSKVVVGEFLSLNEIKCVSPPVDNPGLVDLSLAISEDSFSKAIKYLYYATPEVFSISPICGPYTGYTQIEVTGKNFVNTGPELVYCLFGDIKTPATVISTTTIACDSPDIHDNSSLNTRVSFPVYITLNDKDLSKSAGPITFSYYNFHRLSHLTPLSGPVSGNSTVTLFGEHFAQPGVCNVTVRFGTTEVIAASHNDTMIVAGSPKVALPGSAIVQASLNGQQFTDYEGNKNMGGTNYADDSLNFEYYSNFEVAKFRPKSGLSTGNGTVIIYGAGFTSMHESEDKLQKFNFTAKFVDKDNGKVLGVTHCYDVQVTQMKCLTPPAKPDTKALIDVSKNGVDYYQIRDVGVSEADDYYLYYDAPRITDLNPKYGPVKVETEQNITLTGSNFRCFDNNCATLACQFGTHPYPLFTQAWLVSSTEVICRLPQLSRPETVTVEVSLNGVDFTQDHRTYSYFDAFVLDIAPHYGRNEGGTSISVKGFGFADTGDELLCRFGSKDQPLFCNGHKCEVKATYVSDTEVVCPSYPQAQVVYQSTGSNIQDDAFDVEVSVHGSKFTSSHVKFRYIEQPDFHSIVPRNGTANGGTFTIINTDFHWDTNSEDLIERYANVQCKYVGKDHVEVVSGTILTYPFHAKTTPNAISCVSPAWSTSEHATVLISINGADWAGNFPFEYKEAISARRITPQCGPNKGGTRVTIAGTGFNDVVNLHLKWGTEIAPAELQTLFAKSSSIITGFSAQTPTENTHGGFVRVSLGALETLQETAETSVRYFSDYTEGNLLYLYYKEPHIEYIYPHSGPTSGGTEVTLAGIWFLNYPSLYCTPKCRFGSKVIDGEFVDTVRVKCRSPSNPGHSSEVPIEVSFNGLDWTSDGASFVYYNEPAIDFIYPISGPSSGGTVIEVHGRNFTGLAYTDEFKCRFRSLNLGVPDKFIPATFKSETVVYCTTPGGWGSGNEAVVDVTFNGIDFTNSNSKFYFFQIDGVFPQSGPAEGSPLGVTVYGSGFLRNDNASCSFDAVDYKPLYMDSSKLVCPMPPAKSPDFYGRVNFEVTINGADYKKFGKGFVYYKQPSVQDVEPLLGPATGGSLVTIYGTDFRNDFDVANLTCAVGHSRGEALLIDSTRINCLTPNLVHRPANDSELFVRVALNGQDLTNNTHLYGIYMLIDSAPKGGPIEGGTEVMLRGEGFIDEKPKCKFGIESNHLIVTGIVVDAKHMLCVAPSSFNVPEGTSLPLDVPLEIGFGEIKYSPWTRTDNKFRFYQQPIITSVFPTYGYIDERTEVTITADALHSFFPAITGWKSTGELDMMHAIVCKFGEYGTVPAVFDSKTQIRCITPDVHIERNQLHENTVDLQIALNGQDFESAGPFSFKGSATGLWLVLMWLAMVVMAALIIVLLGVCCYVVWQKISIERPAVQVAVNLPAREALSPYGRQHVFRGVRGTFEPEVSPQRKSYNPLDEELSRFNP